jgi:hypothetical protein
MSKARKSFDVAIRLWRENIRGQILWHDRIAVAVPDAALNVDQAHPPLNLAYIAKLPDCRQPSRRRILLGFAVFCIRY